jgi:hypothetical protein
MNKLTKEKRMQVVAALVEGSSINSTVRITGVSKPTILKLLADLGTACAKYQDEKLRNLPCKRVQAAMRYGPFVLQRTRTSPMR